MLWRIAMILVVCDYSSYKEGDGGGEVDALAHSYDTGGMWLLWLQGMVTQCKNGFISSSSLFFFSSCSKNAYAPANPSDSL